MNREPISSSSNIKSLGYDPDNKVMHVEFSSGVYAYRDAPPEAYEGMRKAKSVGGYFAAQIRGKFESTKLSPAPQQQ